MTPKVSVVEVELVVVVLAYYQVASIHVLVFITNSYQRWFPNTYLGQPTRCSTTTVCNTSAGSYVDVKVLQ